MFNAMNKELVLRSNYLEGDIIDTIYFGGGTPSLLNKDQLDMFFQTIHNTYELSNNPEITLECNPDDLTEDRLIEIYRSGVNRLSIGIQSFDQNILKRMNRAHNHIEAIQCVELAQKVGFKNISVDIIYGIPDTPKDYLKRQIEQLIALNVTHVSAYCLTIENNTYFGHLSRKGELNLPEDEESLLEFNYLVKTLNENGFDQYEISNFAKESYISQHNSSYWLNKKYLGIGPSAHSFNGEERGWNVRNNFQYTNQIEKGKIPIEIEHLTDNDKFNDYILTRLRTKWGLDLKVVSTLLKECPENEFHLELKKHIQFENLIEKDGFIYLSYKGKFITDKIASDLFV